MSASRSSAHTPEGRTSRRPAGPSRGWVIPRADTDQVEPCGGEYMKVKFYGTRGSTPVCECDYQEFGGNTTCVLLTGDHGRIAILDAGSGIRNLGKDLIASGQRQDGTTFIALSHFHWDHIQGFPFFAPAYDPSRHFTISAFGRGEAVRDLRSIFAGQMQPEYFPIPLDHMGAAFAFLEPGGATFDYGPNRVTS